jgi:hypothetical protein
MKTGSERKAEPPVTPVSFPMFQALTIHHPPPFTIHQQTHEKSPPVFSNGFPQLSSKSEAPMLAGFGASMLEMILGSLGSLKSWLCSFSAWSHGTGATGHAEGSFDSIRIFRKSSSEG